MEILGIISIILIIVLFVEFDKLKKENRKLKSEFESLKWKLDNQNNNGSPKNMPVITPQNVIHASNIMQPPNIVSPQNDTPAATPYNSNIIKPAAQPTPVINTQPVLNKPSTVREEKPKNFEKLLGKNILGLSAIGLIFIGLIAFGVLIFSHITDAIKVGGMFVGSVLVSGIGIYLHKRSPNTFTECLTGCGLGAIFISIWVTHLHFEMLSGIAALIIVLLWLLTVGLLGKFFNYKYLPYITYAASLFTTIAAMVGSGEQILQVALYQIVALLLLIVMNKDNSIMFKLSSYTSIVLNAILTIVLSVKIYDAYVDAITVSIGFMFITIMMLAIFNLLIYISLFEKTKKISNMPMSDIVLNNIFYFSNLKVFIITMALLTINVLNVPEAIDRIIGNDIGNTIWYIVIGFIIFVVLTAIYAIHKFVVKTPSIRHYTNMFSEVFAALTIIVITALLRGEAVISYTMSSVFIIALFNLFMANKYRNDAKYFDLYHKSAFAFLCVDALVSLALSDSFFGVLSSLILIIIAVLYNKIKNNNVWNNLTIINTLAFIHLGITSCVFCGEVFDTSIPGLILTSFIAFVINVLHNLKNETTDLRGFKNNIISSETFSCLWIATTIIALSVNGEFDLTTKGGVLSLISALVVIPVGLTNINYVIKNKETGLCILNCFKFIAITVASVAMFTNWFDESFVLTMFFMVIALLYVILGFVKNIKPVRLFGLITILLSVLKMVVFDVWEQDSIIRVIALIVGGVICFAISAGYSYIEKYKLEKIS